jgi:hypothetical protein
MFRPQRAIFKALYNIYNLEAQCYTIYKASTNIPVFCFVCIKVLIKELEVKICKAESNIIHEGYYFNYLNKLL